jgi:hypothetical protein
MPRTMVHRLLAVLLSFQPTGRRPQRELAWRPARVDELL